MSLPSEGAWEAIQDFDSTGRTLLRLTDFIGENTVPEDCCTFWKIHCGWGKGKVKKEGNVHAKTPADLNDSLNPFF